MYGYTVKKVEKNIYELNTKLSATNTLDLEVGWGYNDLL